MIYIGTAGYSYTDWKGPFYPERLDKKEMLGFYSERFSFTELNVTFYRLPNKYMLYNIQKKTPTDFQFAVKAYRGLTHERKDVAEVAAEFTAALEPLQQEGKLACILAQFPASFRNTPANRDYLGRLREHLQQLPVAVEFRHRSWSEDGVFDLLQRLEMAYVCVDEPQFASLMPPVARVTAPIAYVRFHGRNYRKWWRHQHAWERYNYLYSEEELAEWVPKVASIEATTGRTYVSMNNHYQAQAVTNAQMFARMLQKRGLAVKGCSV